MASSLRRHQKANSSPVPQFISPYSNTRTDRYGGSEANRMRLAYEVLEAARAAIGPDYVLGIRLSADELHHLGSEHTHQSSPTTIGTGPSGFGWRSRYIGAPHFGHLSVSAD